MNGPTASGRRTRGRATGGSWSIGIDLGGTFVDCVATDGVSTHHAKAVATPVDPIAGIISALERTAADMGLTVEQLLAASERVSHGTTVGLNALLTGSGSQVGLLTTRGHEDAILIGRVRQKVAGLGPEELVRVTELRKPEPLVPRWRIRGIDERSDAAGLEVVALDEAGLVEAGRDLVSDGCEVLTIAFLWSFLAPGHERRARELLVAALPDVPVVLSSDVAPVVGEYERTAAAVVAAFLLRPFGDYLERLADAIRRRGFDGNLTLLGLTGGALPADLAAARPIEALRSGPVGGIVAANHVAATLGRTEAITADMGGTSFDVGLLVEGTPELADTTIVRQLDLAVPIVDVHSIGAGGGSIAWLDELGGLHVGPRSAGSDPGPACFGRGGREPTVTDADLLLGRIDPRARLASELALDVGCAEEAVGRLATALGLDLVATAAGIIRVADAQMADLVRAVTIERGHDPRGFTLVVFGGAGPLHVGRFAADLGVREVIIPARASVLSAIGLATADYRQTYRTSFRLPAPIDPVPVARAMEVLEERATADLERAPQPRRPERRRWIEMRYRRQTHQLRVAIGPGLDAAALREAVAEFERLYERTYGPGTGYAAAGIEATGAGLLVVGSRQARPDARSSRAAGLAGAPQVNSRAAARRRVFFQRWHDETPVHHGELLRPGHVVHGPAVIDWATTSLLVHPAQHAIVGDTGDVHLELGVTR